MGTKNKPAAFDCYGNALPNEPMFILLARDPDFHRLVMKWAKRRSQDIQCGLRPESDMAMVAEAQACAFAGVSGARKMTALGVNRPTRKPCNRGDWRA